MIPINRHRLWQLVADAGLIAAAWYLAFRLRFDPRVPVPYERLFERTILIVLAIKLVVFVLFGFYNRWWRYVSTRDMWGAARGVTVACIVADLTAYLLHPVRGFPLPRSVAIMDWLLLLAFVAGARMLARTVFERPPARGLMARGKGGRGPPLRPIGIYFRISDLRLTLVTPLTWCRLSMMRRRCGCPVKRMPMRSHVSRSCQSAAGQTEVTEGHVASSRDGVFALTQSPCLRRIE